METAQLSLMLFIGGVSFAFGKESTSNASYLLEADKSLTASGHYLASSVPYATLGNRILRDHSNAERRMDFKLLQMFFHPPQSGQSDEGIKKLMHHVRCGNADITSRDPALATSAGIDIEEEVDAGQISKHKLNQVKNNSETNAELERRSVDRPRQKRVRRANFLRSGKDREPIRWKKDRLTWKLTRPSRHLSVVTQRKTFRRAFAVWLKHLPFTIEEERTSKVPDMDIWFATGKHGTYEKDPAFNETDEGTTAHAFPPFEVIEPICGDIHFEEGDAWTNETLFFLVAVHEIGHAIGFKHTRDPQSIMHPPYPDKAELSEGDIKGIETVYGSTRKQRIRHGRRRNTTPQPRLTSSYTPKRADPRYTTTRRTNPGYQTDTRKRIDDTYYTTQRTNTGYRTTRKFTDSSKRTAQSNCIERLKRVNAVFKDPSTEFTNLYFAISGNEIDLFSEKGVLVRSRPLHCFFPGAPSDADVVFSDPSKNRVVFIKSDIIWEYNDQVMSRYARIDRKLLQETPQIAFTMEAGTGGRDTKTLMFGDKYWWIFDEESSRETQYKPISEFVRNFPKDIKFAVEWNDGQVYVIQQDGSFITFPSKDKRRPVRLRSFSKPPEWMIPLCNLSNPGTLNLQVDLTCVSCNCCPSIGLSNPTSMLFIMITFMTLSV